MKLKSGLLYIYSSYTHIEQITNPFVLYSQLQDLCKDDYVVKEQALEFFEISKKLNIFKVLIEKGVIDGKKYLIDMYPIYSSYFTLNKLKEYILIVSDVIKYKEESITLQEDKVKTKHVEEEKSFEVTHLQKPKKKKKGKQIPRYEIKDGVLISYNGTLRVVSIPESVKEIGLLAFTNKSYQKIRKIVIPNTVKHIHSLAFSNLPYLKEIKLGKVKKIDKYAFYGCDCIINCKDKCKQPLWHNNWNVKSKLLFIKKRLTVNYGV